MRSLSHPRRVEYLKTWLELKTDRRAATALEYGVIAGVLAVVVVSRVDPTRIATLMGQSKGTLALDLYSSGASREALTNAIEDVDE